MRVVDTESELREVGRSLDSAPVIYLDTEFDSSRDGKTLCLLQIGDGQQVHLIDTLRLSALEPLQPLARPDREWVLHAGLQDVELLKERLRLREPPRLFDTQVAWAMSSAEASVSLAYIKFRLLGVRSGKPHQADDWRRRPLGDSQLAYAAADVEALPELRERLVARLERLGRRRLVYPASKESCWPEREPIEPLALESFRNAWQLDPPNQAALRYLVGWFNALSAAGRTEAPESKTLFSIASRLPETREQLARIKGVSRRFANLRGDDLTRELMRAAADVKAEHFVPIDPPPYASFEEIRVDGWLALARAEICAELQIAPELALPGRLVRRMSARVVQSGERRSALDVLEGWRKELCAEAFTRFIAESEEPAQLANTPR